MLSPVKLAAGQAWSAWRRYPGARRELAEARPGPPILVTGMYRSGTTWVGAMLAPGRLWHLHEPFNPNRGLWRDELAYARADTARADIDQLVRRLLRGRHRSLLRLPHAGRWFAPLRLLPFQPRRVLLKDPSAALLSEYLVRRHGMRALILLRHPGAVVRSFLRLGWPTGALVERLLSSADLMQDWLAPLEASMAAAIGRRDAASGAVLYGCVATLLLGFASRNPQSMTRLSFEELCEDPIVAFRSLYETLGLHYDDRVRDEHVRLCSGGDGEERPHGVIRASASVAGRWRIESSRAELETIREVWGRFDLPLYREPADWEWDPEDHR